MEPLDKSLDETANAPDDADELQHRLQRLEDAIASLQNTHVVEEQSNKTAENNDQVKSETPPVESKSKTIEKASPSSPDRLPWLLVDVFAEMRATVRMFFDMNYHVAWSTRIIAIGLLFLVFTSGWWFALANIPVVGTLVDKLVCVVLTYVAFKALNREARRYMEWRKHR